jgi:transcriptional regulator
MLLGRPKGIGKSKLDVYQTEIVALLKNGATKTWIARKYGTSRRNLSHWMKQRGIV